MDIKIITCHYAYNYGAVLQTYALYSYLISKGHNVEVINYRPWYYKGSTSSNNMFRRLFRRIIRIPDNIKSERVFYNFLKQNIRLSMEYTSYQDLMSANLKGDLFIAGSDQIWNTNLPNGKDLAFYLDFTKSGKKVTYAASLGMDNISKSDKSFFRDQLKKLDNISVREITAKNLLHQIGVDDVEVVLDPVYLLSSEIWKKKEKKPNFKYAGKYILVYVFNHQKEIFIDAKKFAKKFGYKIYSVNTFWEYILMDCDQYFWNCTPFEFIYLINHAECIFTNSFHGFSFSLIFNKPVYVYRKNDSGNSRMTDLMKILNVDEKKFLYDDKFDGECIAYDEVNNNIKSKIQKSILYLNKVMGEL